MSAAAAAPIAIAVPVATLAYLVFRRAKGTGGRRSNEEKQPPATTTTIAPKEQEDYGDLDSIVSFSSRVIAAARAVEHERPDAFIRDPLAESLAGDRAMRVARQRAAAAEAAADGANAKTSPQPRAVPRLVMRTAFLDDAVLVAASGGDTSATARRLLTTPLAADALAPLSAHVRAFASSPEAPPVHRLQVVLLGAGMDARPWRLPLPPGRVRWIEVDRADVIAAKKKALSAIGAEVPLPEAASPSSRPPSSSAPPAPAPPLVTQQRPASAAVAAGEKVVAVATTATAAAATSSSAPSSAAAPAPALPSRPPSAAARGAVVSIRSLQRSQSAAAAAAALGLTPDDVTVATVNPHKFPLKASSWAGVAADLTKPGWTAALARDAAFDPRVPTLWVAEGLLYYLDPATVPGMLREAAEVSAPGSALVATVITDATLEAMRGGGGGGGGGGGEAADAGGAKKTDGSDKAPADGNNKTDDTTPKAPLSEQVLSSAPALTSQFVWGAPAGDVEGYFRRSGWRPLQRPTWSRAAEAYGWRAEKRAGSRVPEESQVQFLVAAVEKEDKAAASGGGAA